jgi:hypothetical protein
LVFGSLLLILGAVALLGMGLARGSNALLVGSIAASLLAAIALVVGARRAAAGRVDEPEFNGEPDPARGNEGYQREASDVRVASPPTEPIDRTAEPEPALANAVAAETAAPPLLPSTPPEQAERAEVDDDLDDDPPDEPSPQLVTPADAARVARMSVEVLVIDGRPRYHLAGCVHLLGRASEPLPVGEAVELGFTPCSLCEPAGALLAEARRV